MVKLFRDERQERRESFDEGGEWRGFWHEGGYWLITAILMILFLVFVVLGHEIIIKQMRNALP